MSDAEITPNDKIQFLENEIFNLKAENLKMSLQISSIENELSMILKVLKSLC